MTNLNNDDPRALEIRASMQKVQAELQKPPEVMDTDEIEFLAEKHLDDEPAYGMSNPSGPSIEEMVKAIKSRCAAEQRAKRTKRALRLAGATAAAAVLLAGITFGAARAFQWQSLLRFFTPVSDLLAVSAVNAPDHLEQPEVPRASDEEQAEENEPVFVQSTSADELIQADPKVEGVLSSLAGMYTIEDANVFKDPIMTALFLQLSDQGGTECFVNATLFAQAASEDAFPSLAYERNAGQLEPMVIGDTDVATYSNEDSFTASWNSGHATYQVWSEDGEKARQAILDLAETIIGGDY